MNGRCWLENIRTDRLGWPQNVRTSEPRWLKRWMPPSGRSSLKQAQLTQLGYFPGASPPPPILAWFPYATWVRHWLAPCNEEWMPQWLTGLGLHEQPCMSNGDSTSSNSSHARHFPYEHSPSWVLTHKVHHWSPVQKVGLLPSGTPNNQHCKGAHAKTTEASAVGTELHRAMRNHPKQHQRHPATMWLPQGVLENMTVRTTLTAVVMSLTKKRWRRM